MADLRIPAAVLEEAADWRATRSSVSLNWLYWHFINDLPAQLHSITPLLELLGKPDCINGHSYIYASELGPHGRASLYLETDLEDRLACWGID
jgi:hypothetical protein